MKISTLVKLLMSTFIGIAIDRALSITEILRQALEPLMTGPFLEPAKPLIFLLFYIIEIPSIYGILNQFKWLEDIIKYGFK